MPTKRLPQTGSDQGQWGTILNSYLTQLSPSDKGGINYWTNTTKPTSLTPDDEGLTGVNTQGNTVERWSGTAWEILLQNQVLSYTAENVANKNIEGGYVGLDSTESISVVGEVKQLQLGVVVNPQTISTLLAKETDLGVKFDSHLIYYGVSTGPNVPANLVTWFDDRVKPILDAGKTPIVNLEPFGDSNINGCQPSINAGGLDAAFTAFANKCAADGRELIVIFLHEFNLGGAAGYPWACYGRTNNSIPGFISAFQRLSNIFKTLAPNVKVAIQYNVTNFQNNLEAFKTFYPGDAFVDIIGLSNYNRGGLDYANYKSFEKSFDQAYWEIERFGPAKPMAIFETGAHEDGSVFLAVGSGGSGLTGTPVATIQAPPSVPGARQATFSAALVSGSVVLTITNRGARYNQTSIPITITGVTGTTLPTRVASIGLGSRAKWWLQTFDSIKRKYPKLKYFISFLTNNDGTNGKWDLETVEEKEAFRSGFNRVNARPDNDPARQLRANPNLLADFSNIGNWTQVGSNQGTLSVVANNTIINADRQPLEADAGVSNFVRLSHNGTAGTYNTNLAQMASNSSYDTSVDYILSGWFKSSVKSGSSFIWGIAQNGGSGGTDLSHPYDLTDYWQFISFVISTGWSAPFFTPQIGIGHNNVAFNLDIYGLKFERGNEPSPSGGGGSSNAVTLTGSQTIAGKKTFSNSSGGANLALSTTGNPTSPSNGDIWRDIAGNAISYRITGMTERLVGSIYSQITSGIVANTTTETSAINTGGAGVTTILPSNLLYQGRSIRVKASGVYGSQATPGTLTVRFKLGTITIVSTGAFTVPASQTNRFFDVDLELSCRGVGVSGVVTVQGMMRYFNGTTSTLQAIEMNNSGSISIDTTINQTIDITAQWSAANTSDTISARIVNIEILN